MREAWGEISSSRQGGFALSGARRYYHEEGGERGGSSSLSQGFAEAPQLAARRRQPLFMDTRTGVGGFFPRSLRPTSFYIPVLPLPRRGDPSRTLVLGGISVLPSHLLKALTPPRTAPWKPNPAAPPHSPCRVPAPSSVFICSELRTGE